MTYSTFKNKKSSEKITLIHAHAKQYLYEFDSYSGDVYSKDMSYFVVGIEKNGTAQTSVSSIGAVADGKYFFDITSKTLYVHTTSFSTDEWIVRYRFFFANAPINLSWDLTDTGEDVYYQPRATRSVPYSVEVDNTNTAVVLIGSGSLTLDNTDKGLDDIFTRLYWENQSFKIYSYNRELDPSDAKLIYDGIIEYRSYNDTSISFKVKTKFEFFKRDISTEAYASTDGVSSDLVGTLKSRIFGKANGVKLVSTDAIPDDGFDLTGTLSGNAASTTVTGSGTAFLDEVSPRDIITTSGGHEFTVLSVQSDTSLTTTDDLDVTFTSETATNEPEQGGVPFKNRTFDVSGNSLRETVVTINQKISSDKYVLDSVSDIESGDILEYSGQFKTVETITSGSRTLILSSGFDPEPNISDTLTRNPVQNVYYNKKRVAESQITFNNNSITLSDGFEATLAVGKVLDTGSWSYTSGNRTMTRSAANEALETIIKPRDYVSLDGINYYEVLNITKTTIDVRTTFGENNSTSQLYVKTIDLVTNSSILSADSFGETEDGTTSGTWVKTGSQTIKKLLTEAGLSDSLNTSSFTTATQDQNATVSIVEPFEANSTSIGTLKDLFDKISESLLASLIIDADQLIKYNINEFSLDFDNIQTISKYDVISWKPKIETNELRSKTIIEYNNKQINYISEESSINSVTVTSDLVEDLIELERTQRINTVYLEAADAGASARRLSLLHELNNTVLEVKGSLNLSDIGVGDTIRVDFDLATNFGDIDTNERIMVVTTVKNDGESITLVLSDLGNMFARRCVISEDTANNYTSTDSEERLLYSYITDSRGLVDTDETTKGRNLII